MKEFDYNIVADPEIFQQNRLEAHSDHRFYASKEEMECDRSSFCYSLNGDWNFAFAPNWAAADKDFFRTEEDCHAWKTIPVPAHIQMEGYGVPQYCNTQYPWDGKEELMPGQIPSIDNPVASYVKYFTLPKDWLSLSSERPAGDRKEGETLRENAASVENPALVKNPVYISFQGVESALALWCNGHYVGYSEDSFTPSEFDLAPYLLAGENKLAVAVFRFSAGSWYEDQDFFRFSGIFREVFLYTVPRLHLRDLKLTSRLTDDFTTGSLSVDLKLQGACPGAVAELVLMDQERKVCGELKVSECAGAESDCARADRASGRSDDCARIGRTSGQSDDCARVGRTSEQIDDCARTGREKEQSDDCAQAVDEKAGKAEIRRCGASLSLNEPRLWSAEDPYLYRLQIRLLDSNGQLLELIEEPVGFRRFELREGIMCLNGKRIVFKGVNRHEFSSVRGRAVSKEDIWNDLLIMKRNNINAVRTSHYPNQSVFYRYCDRLGLYVIDETNLETHGVWESIIIGANDLSAAIPGDRPEAYAVVMDRARSMYERDKNHASILIWSCGNESLGGWVFYEMSQHFRRWDPSRLVHYEGVTHDSRYPDTTDIYSTMYYSVDQIRQTLKETDKPYISCEYAHAMGNSCGAMHKYTDLTDTEPRYQGGFIWDFADQSITTKNRFGEDYEAYGGDFGDRPCDYSFSGNGIVYGGEGHGVSPKMQEVKYNYSSIRLTFCDRQVTICNDNLFTDLSAYESVAVLKREGKLIAQMPLQLSLAPMSEKSIELPIPIPQEEGEYVEEISFRLREDRAWAKAGHEVAYGQGVYGAFDSSVLLAKRAYAPKDSCVSGDGCEIKCGCELENGEVLPDKAVAKNQEENAAEKKRPQGRQRLVGDGKSKLRVARGWMNTGVYGEDFSALFSGRFGGLVSYCYRDKMLFRDIPRPNFWRPMTENDLGNMQPFRSGQWKIASSFSSMMKEHGRAADYYRVEELEDSVRVTYTYHLATSPSRDCFLSYRVYSDGSVACHLEMEPTAEIGQLPEFGLLFTMDADYEKLRWYGRGPQETYADRPHGKLDLFSNRVADNMARYLRPSECGNKIDVRWAECMDTEGHGVLFAMADSPFHFSALPYSPDMIDCAQHAYELPRVDKTWIRISKAQMGVGGDDSWGALVHPEYCIDNSRKLEFNFIFRGI